MRRFATLALLAVVVSCRDATSPVTIDGAWRFTFSGMSGTSVLGDLTCDAQGFDFVITQTGRTFAGTQTGSAALLCTSAGHAALSEDVAGETIVAGAISGNTVTFRLGSIAGEHAAALSGGGAAMSGRATWDFTPGQDLVLTGTFTASRL